jgi:hypothetical protein
MRLGQTVFWLVGSASEPAWEEYKAEGTEHRAQSTEHRAQSTEHRAQSTEHRAQSTEHRAQSTEQTNSLRSQVEFVLCFVPSGFCSLLSALCSLYYSNRPQSPRPPVASPVTTCENSVTLPRCPEPTPNVPSPPETDPVLRHARREAIIIGLTWLAATIYCCVSSYLLGYDHPGHKLGKDDVKPILGVPMWVFWSVLVPWGVCAVFTFWFAGFYMADDDLGRDHTGELEGDIREGALNE